MRMGCCLQKQQVCMTHTCFNCLSKHCEGVCLTLEETQSLFFSSGCYGQARWKPVDYVIEHIFHLKVETIGCVICRVVWEDIFLHSIQQTMQKHLFHILESFATAI